MDKNEIPEITVNGVTYVPKSSGLSPLCETDCSVVISFQKTGVVVDHKFEFIGGEWKEYQRIAPDQEHAVDHVIEIGNT